MYHQLAAGGRRICLMKQTVAILFGGSNSEYEVSLHSAAAVIRAVDKAAYDIVLLGITRAGQGLYFTGDADEVENDTWWQTNTCVPAVLSPNREDHGVWLMYPDGAEKRTLDIVFPVLHGRNGEDGSVQGLLQLANIPCVGCGVLASALCMDKDIAHQLALNAGIHCPAYTTLYSIEINTPQKRRDAALKAEKIGYPLFVKPACEGSSFGISRANNFDELQTALQIALRYGEKIVVEQAIEGFEVGCAVLGNDDLVVGSPDAIQLQKGFFDYHEKYNLETAKIVSAPLALEDVKRVQDTAMHLYRLMGCQGFARVDVFFTPEHEIVFNEINTIPGLTAHSRYPGMLAGIGISFPEMVQRLLDLAVEL